MDRKSNPAYSAATALRTSVDGPCSSDDKVYPHAVMGATLPGTACVKPTAEAIGHRLSS